MINLVIVGFEWSESKSDSHLSMIGVCVCVCVTLITFLIVY